VLLTWWRRIVREKSTSSRKGLGLRSASSTPLSAELLEARNLLATPISGATFAPTYIIFRPDGKFGPYQSPGPVGYIPSQIQHAYGIDQITFAGGTIKGDGTGETIAIVDAYDDPVALQELQAFDQTFSLPDPPTFQRFDQNGGTNYPGTDPTGGWETEEALDIEWSHALAPGANIDLVEANTPNDLFTAETTAAGLPGVDVVSNSWGSGEFSSENTLDSTFTTPTGHIPVTFLASTGDSGAPGGYPAYSPNVVAVGGTSLFIDSQGNYQSESGWSDGGGGISQYESQPAYQNGVVTQSTSQRATPDVSMNADPNTGVAVYDSFNNGTQTPWEQVGGTSLSCPSWAGIIAIADQGRALAGEASLDGVKDTLPMLYKLPASDFHDITTGNNGFPAGPGYDLVTGIGTPVANLLVPGLVGTPLDSISGQVFNDLNGNGSQDPGEPGLANWTVYLDVAGTGVYQTGDPVTTTDANGDFAITSLADGTYPVREVPQSGWVQTTATQDITVANGQHATGVSIGDFQLATISGEVFNDLNGNGTLDPGEPGLQGWTVDLLNSQNNVIATTTTDANGDYSLTGIGPGTFTVQEVLQSGWTQTAPGGPGTYRVTTVSGATDGGDNFGNFLPVTISGEVFNDLNGNGSLDPGEPGLQGWTIQLLNSGNTVIASATSDSNGNYSFANVGSGTYTIRETLQNGWVETYPAAPGTHTVTVVSALNAQAENFGDFLPTTINGEVFNDLNGNGVKDSGDPGLQGWTVELLSSGGAVLSTTVSDINGNYSFVNVGPGTFTIKEVLQSGWFISLPTGAGTYSVTSTSGTAITNENFGDFQSATVTGEVFNDLNGDGILDNGEPGLQGWTVELFDNSGKLASSAVTDANGNYLLTGAGPGTLTVTEVVPTGWIQTFPTPPAGHSVNATSGGLVTGQNFGNFQKTTISGELFVDVNDTGSLAAGDSGLSGWTVQLLNATTSALLATQTTSANGGYTFGVGPGRFRIREIAPAGWIQTTTNPADIFVNSGTASSGVNFGNFQLGVVSGQTFQDFNGNGVQDANDTALAGWTVQILNPVTLAVLNSQTTAANGTFSLVAGGPGTYLVREVLQSGWLQTTTNPAAIVITASGTVASGQSFGNFQLATIDGQVFLDNNGDGSENGADSGLQGWTIQLYNAGTGALLASQTSNATGNYSFSNLGPGSYTVREVLQSGWVQTTVSPASITTSSGGTTTGVNFGDFLLGVISGEVFQDMKGSGVVTSGDNGLQSWTVQLLDATQGTVLQTQITDGTGNYQFSSIGPGTYKVREVVQSGWVQTTANPANGTISSGATITGQNFGDFQLISIGGRVFVDTTADGIDSPSKPGFNGFTIQLYRDVAGTGHLVQGADPLVASMVSTTINGQAGEYVFNGIGPGNYLVFEVKQSGLLQTAPAPVGAYSVVSLSGANVLSNDFGNLGSTNQSFVYQLYADLLHRRVDPSGMLYFSGALAQGASRTQVVQGIESSQEYRTDEVNSLYQAYLGRDVDPSGLSFAFSLLSGTPLVLGSQNVFLQLQADILGSTEFYQTQGGGTNAGFLAAVYHDVLGRVIDASGAAAFGAALSAGVSRTMIAKAILSSVEAEQVLVEGDYLNYLQRSADAGGMAAFVGALQHGAQVGDILTAIIASDEYFSRV